MVSLTVRPRPEVVPETVLPRLEVVFVSGRATGPPTWIESQYRRRMSARRMTDRVANILPETRDGIVKTLQCHILSIVLVQTVIVPWLTCPTPSTVFPTPFPVPSTVFPTPTAAPLAVPKTSPLFAADHEA